MPLLVGAGLGGAGAALMHRLGLLAERSGLVILVCAVAAFYPVFAFAGGGDIGSILFHLSVFGGFCAAAAWGFHAGMAVLAALLVAHGLFDAVAILTSAPGPDWWPPFCAGVDLAAGGYVLWLLKRKEIPA